ncbi:zinc finger protein 768-like [Gigantopelta aegis]|uniref:zinc finger protein 768-like n=1 Tax=Gigantopelta aegis TaxID=1735272 RepID=UPI001B88B9E0|nr:zinc finger protein 768-like [Gigantopelta aegis]
MPKSFLIRKKRNRDLSWSTGVDSAGAGSVEDESLRAGSVENESVESHGQAEDNLPSEGSSSQKDIHGTPTPNYGELLESPQAIHSPESVSEDRPTEEFSLGVLSGTRLSHDAFLPEACRTEYKQPEKHYPACATPKKTRKRRLFRMFPPSTETFPCLPAHSLPPFPMAPFPANSTIRHPAMYSPYTCSVYPHPVPFSPPNYVRAPFFVVPLVHSQPRSCSSMMSFPDKLPSPVGVLSPAEIPSPSGLIKADEPSQTNGSSGSGRFPYPRQNGVAFLDTPAVQNAPYHSPPAPKIMKTSIEVVNGGFGIKNPLFASEKEGVGSVADMSQQSWLPKVTLHTCPMCAFQCDTSKMMQTHLKSHKEIKRYLCSFCGKGFNDTFDLKRHTRTHTGVRPYKCDICGKGFTQRCSLESHSKKIHGMQFEFAFNERRGKVYVCEDCGHSSNDPEVHYLHLRTTHPNNPAIMKCHDRRQFKFVETIESRLSQQVSC